MSETLTAPSGTISTIELELDGNDQLGNPRNWSDNAQRVDVKRVGYKSQLLGACLCANGGVATSFGATPARQVQAKLNRIPMIGSAYDLDPANDELLIDNLTIEIGENYGPIVEPTEIVLFDVLSSVSADCVIAGGTASVPAVNLHHHYFVYAAEDMSVGATHSFTLPESGFSHAQGDPDFTFIATLTRDSAGATALHDALVAQGYTPPNPISYGQIPLLDPDQRPIPAFPGSSQGGMFHEASVTEGRIDTANYFWWEVDESVDWGDISESESPGLMSTWVHGGGLDDNTKFDFVGLASVEIPAVSAGSPAAGVSILVFLKPLGL